MDTVKVIEELLEALQELKKWRKAKDERRNNHDQPLATPDNPGYRKGAKRAAEKNKFRD